MGCGCSLPIYLDEQNALAAAEGGGPRPVDVPAVFRCPASLAWHVCPVDGLPGIVLESTGRRLVYALLNFPEVNLHAFRKDVLGISDERGPNGHSKRWRRVRQRYVEPLKAVGVVAEELNGAGRRNGVLRLVDVPAGNRVVQVGVEQFLQERGQVVAGG